MAPSGLDYPVPVPLRDDAVDAWHDAPRNEHGVIALDEHMEFVLRPVLARFEHALRDQIAEWVEARVRRCPQHKDDRDAGHRELCAFCWSSAELRAVLRLVRGETGPTTRWVASRIEAEEGVLDDV